MVSVFTSSNVKQDFFHVSALFFAFCTGFRKSGSSWLALRLSPWSYRFCSRFRFLFRFSKFELPGFFSGPILELFRTSWFHSSSWKFTYACTLLFASLYNSNLSSFSNSEISERSTVFRLLKDAGYLYHHHKRELRFESKKDVRGKFQGGGVG